MPRSFRIFWSLLLLILTAAPLAFAREGERERKRGKGKRMTAASSGSGQRERGARRRQREAAKVMAATGASAAANPALTSPKYRGKFNPNAHTGGTLYVIDGAQSTQSNLYVVDPADGSYTLVGATGFSLTAIDIHPLTGEIYATEGTNENGDQPRLVELNPLTGAGTAIGPLGIVAEPAPDGGTRTGITLADLTFDANGTLYGWSRRITYDLYTVNLTTGAATRVGNEELRGTHGNGLAIVSGRMYLAGYPYGPLLEIDPAAGEVISPVELNGASADGRKFNVNVTAMATNAAGTIYATFKTDDTGSPAWDLVTINRTSGNVTTITTALPAGIDAIDFDKDTGVLYAAEGCWDTGTFYTVNPATGATTAVGESGAYLTGLAVHPTTSVIYAVTGMCDEDGDNIPELMTVNPGTGLATMVAEITWAAIPADEGEINGCSTGMHFTDLEFSPTGILYGWVAAGNCRTDATLGSTYDLYTINTTTAVATRVGDSELYAASGGIAWSGSELVGALFGTSGPLVTITPASGQIQETILRGNPARTHGRFYSGVAGTVASDDGTMFGVTHDNSDDGSVISHLVTIDPATGIVTDRGETVPHAEGIAYTNALLIGGGQAVPGIPTITEYGIAGLAILLAVGALLLIRMRSV